MKEPYVPWYFIFEKFERISGMPNISFLVEFEQTFGFLGVLFLETLKNFGNAWCFVEEFERVLGTHGALLLKSFKNLGSPLEFYFYEFERILEALGVLFLSKFERILGPLVFCSYMLAKFERISRNLYF